MHPLHNPSVNSPIRVGAQRLRAEALAAARLYRYAE